MSKHLCCFCVGACLSLIAIANGAAQSITSGDITGTVTDPSGASVPDALITVTNVNTSASQNTLTTQQGTYRFAFLPSGKYNVTVRATGFQVQQLGGIIVSAGQPTAADFKLQMAAASQTIEVSESANALQTQNGDVSTTYSPEMIQNSPNPGGDITYIAQTAPGVVTVSYTHLTLPTNREV